MKVLTPLIVLLTLSSSFLIADDIKNLDDYISKNKKQQFSYDYEKVESQSLKLRDSWISPLRLNYAYSKSNPFKIKQTKQSASLRIDQPIFQSGGIYYGIKFAEATKVNSTYSLDFSKKSLIKNTLSLLMQIKQADLRIKKQKFRIKNSEISLEQKKEQYLSGQLDSSFLDNAIIARNSMIQILYDIQTMKEKLISKFEVLSDLDYKKTTIPYLKNLDKNDFLKNNILLDISKSEIEKNKYAKDMTIAKYLPKISFNAGYNWQSTKTFIKQESDFYDYGIKLSIPININTFRDIESSKLDFLKSKTLQNDKLVQLKATYEQVMQNLKNIEKKRLLSVENKDIYMKLLTDTKTLYQAGQKTKYDVDLLQNSYNIQEIEYKILDIDKQLELLTLYEMYR